MTIDENKFDTLAEQTLNHFLDTIDDALGDILDVDMDNGMLTIKAESGAQYIINKHGPNRQIWVSSPLSGASHYAFDETRGGWTDTRDGESLPARLAGELSQLAGVALSLD